MDAEGGDEDADADADDDDDADADDDDDFRWICVGFMDSWGIWCPWLDFLLISSILFDFIWICVDFMDSWGPRSDPLWHPVAGSGLRVWTILVVWSDQGPDDFDD